MNLGWEISLPEVKKPIHQRPRSTAGRIDERSARDRSGVVHS